jgi:hypothetical protein
MRPGRRADYCGVRRDRYQSQDVAQPVGGGHRPWHRCLARRRAGDGHPPGHRATRPRVHDVPRAVLRRLRPHRPGPGLDRAGCPLSQLPTTPDRPALPHLRGDQAGRRSHQRRPATVRPLRAASPTPLRALRPRPGDRPVAPTTASPTSAMPASAGPKRPARCAHGDGPATSPPPAHRYAPVARPGRCAPARAATPPQPVTAVWPEGPVCERCYTSALRTRATCHSCGQQRRLVVPHGPDATTCSDCAGLPATHTCSDCGVEDKLYERGRCDRCALRRRVTDLLATSDGDVPAALVPVVKAICDAPVTRSALNWLRQSASAELLGDIAAGRLPLTHATLDGHPHPRAAAYLRGILTAHGALPARDEDLARFERWLPSQLERVTQPRRPSDPPRLRHLARRPPATPPRRPQPATTHRNQRRPPTDPHRRRLPRLAPRTRHPPGRRRPGRHRRLGAHQPRCRHHRRLPGLDRRARPHHPAHRRAHPFAHRHRDAPRHPLGHHPSPPPRRHPQHPRPRRRLPRPALRPTPHPHHRPHPPRPHPYPRPAHHPPRRPRHRHPRTPRRTHHHPGRHRTTPQHRRHPQSVAVPRPPPRPPPQPSPPRARGYATLACPPIPGRRAALVHLAATLPAAVLADLLGLHPTTAVKWINNANGNWNTYAAALLDQAPTNP